MCWRAAHQWDSTHLSFYFFHFLYPSLFLLSLFLIYTPIISTWQVLLMPAADVYQAPYASDFPSSISIQFILWRKGSIPLLSKGICIDCENPYSCWYKQLHCQNYHLKLWPDNSQWVLAGWLSLVSHVLHLKGKLNHWLTRENSEVLSTS